MITAFYWAVITMATTGYGDVTPKTEVGRIVAMVASVAGISTFTALVSLLAENFISSSMRRMMGMHKFPPAWKSSSGLSRGGRWGSRQ